jgi:hypothetical protein
MNKLIKQSIVILTLCALLLHLGACAKTKDPADKAKSVRATVIEIEKYGHAVLDISTTDFIAQGYELGDIVSVRFDSYQEDIPFYDGYYSNPGTAMLRGLTPEANIALCINYGNFSVEAGLKVGDTVEITLTEKAGMLALQKLCSLKYSDRRADYPDDVTFANFRAVTIGRIGDGKLYRSASPIDNRHGRAGYADDLIASANVSAILNLADSMEDIEKYLKAEDFDSEYYLSLYQSGNVIAIDLTGDFTSKKFSESIVEGLTFLARNDPPYSIHCTEGKDRAGFTAMLLGALMGAELEEIIDDYMTSFYNYYGIDKESDPKRYEIVLNNNLIAMLYHVMEVDTYEALKQVDLEASATKYLIETGMSENDILALKEKLS